MWDPFESKLPPKTKAKTLSGVTVPVLLTVGLGAAGLGAVTGL